MDCPPPLSSEDEDDDFGDFHTVFEKSTAAEGGSIKSRIHLDISVSPEANDSSSFVIPPRPIDFSIESNSPPPELPPSLPMSPETPDIDFFALQDAGRKSPVTIKNSFSEVPSETQEGRPSGDIPGPIPGPIAEKQESDLFQANSFEISNQENINIHVPQTDDLFASFVSTDQCQSSDTDFFPFIKDGDVNSGHDDFTDFSSQMCAGRADDAAIRPELDDGVEMEADLDDTASMNTLGNSQNTETFACIKKDSTEKSEIVNTTDFSTTESLYRKEQAAPPAGKLDSNQEVTMITASEENEFVPSFDIETPSPLHGAQGEKSVFSWDSFEENTQKVVEEIGGHEADEQDHEVQRVDDEPDKFALFTDEENGVVNLSKDQFVSFPDFETTPAADFTAAGNHQEMEIINQKTDCVNNSNTPSSDDSVADDFASFHTKPSEEEIGVEKLGHDSDKDFGVFADQDDEEGNKASHDQNYHVSGEGGDFSGFAAFPQSDEDDSPDDFCGFTEPVQTPESTEFTNLPEKIDTDEFANFATGDTDKLTNKEACDGDNFGYFADFAAQSDDNDFSDFADFKETGDAEFGDFGDFDSKLPAASMAAAVDDLDDEFDEFADFGSASLHPQEQPSPTLKPSLEDKTEPMSLKKMIRQCYGGSNTDEENEVGSGTYTDGQLLMCKVHETDAQFAVGTKWLSTPSFNTQVTTLCLSANNNPPTSKPAQVQGVVEDEFSVFGSVDTNKLSNQTSSGLLPEDLSHSHSAAPPPSKKHADILSGYKKEQAKKLSSEAAAIVDSLPDLTFMLSSVLMFPVKASS